MYKIIHTTISYDAPTAQLQVSQPRPVFKDLYYDSQAIILVVNVKADVQTIATNAREGLLNVIPQGISTF